MRRRSLELQKGDVLAEVALGSEETWVSGMDEEMVLS